MKYVQNYCYLLSLFVSGCVYQQETVVFITDQTRNLCYLNEILIFGGGGYQCNKVISKRMRSQKPDKAEVRRESLRFAIMHFWDPCVLRPEI